VGVGVVAMSVLLGVVSVAGAAFPGRDGMLAVQPTRGAGLVLVGADGRGARRICTRVSVCGHPGRPEFSPDGRSVVFSGPAVRLVGTDGICENCQFRVGSAPAFRGDGRRVSFMSRAGLVEADIDGLSRKTAVLRSSLPSGPVSGAVWSSRGTLAVDAGGRIWVGQPDRLRPMGPGSGPSWSPDGSRIAVARDGWITVLGVPGGRPRRLARGTAPAFSPNGRSIAFLGSGRRVDVISSSGGGPRPVGHVRGLAVDWQPLPARPAPCVSPPGATVLARSAQAVVTTETGPNPGHGILPATAVMGCLVANGRERLLERSTFNNVDDATDYPIAAVGGIYAGVVVHEYDEHYGGDTKTVHVFNQRSGLRSGFGGESSNCDGCTGIDQLLIGRDGVSAVHVAADKRPDPIKVTCATASSCVSYNQSGQVSATGDPPTGPWTPAQVANIHAMSCPSPSLCVGVASAFFNSPTAIYTSPDPAGGTSAWTKTQIAGVKQIPDVSCPSTTLCVAAASGGSLLVSTDPTGGPSAWSVDAVDGNTPIWAVSCPSTSECFAVDGAGNVISSSDPSGGASAWNTRPAGIRPLARLSCPSVSLCVGAPLDPLPAGLVVSSNPASGPWTTTNSSFQAWDAACPSTSLCVAVGPSGVSVSSDPTADVWTTYGLSDVPDSVSCPTTTSCAIGGESAGYAFLSSDPTAGADTWTPVLADQINCLATPDLCSTEQIIASDRTGVHTLGSSTEFEAQTGQQFTRLALTGGTLTWTTHGSPTTAHLKP
jgi:hypothetical protein